MRGKIRHKTKHQEKNLKLKSTNLYRKTRIDSVQNLRIKGLIYMKTETKKKNNQEQNRKNQVQFIK